MKKQKLPIGIQEFSEIIQGGYVYVDKTEHIHRLISEGKYYFLSRPRRFGKSLLITTLRAIFEGKRELFSGLWIEDKIGWEPRPVIHLDFTQISKRAADLNEGIAIALAANAQRLGVELSEKTNAGKLVQLIETLGRERKVAILVDEYDKPLIDNIDNPDLLNKNRQELKDLYSVLKGNDANIEFLMLTGVTKFSQVSIFSDLNNLRDISRGTAYSQLLGYTIEEIQHFFPAYLEELINNLKHIYPDVVAEMRAWYNGYSWDGVNFVYNPFSILNLLANREFEEYWFATGTPTFLMKLIRTRGYSVFDLENKEISLSAFNRLDLDQIELNALLFQTGYLTIKAINHVEQYVILDFPNREVSRAFSMHLLAEFAEKTHEGTDSIIRKMNASLRSGQVDAFMENVQALFAEIAYPLHPAKGSGISDMEKYYHSIFYLMLRLLGYNIQAEVFTHTGRIDAVVTTPEHVYVVEFKIGDAAAALAQIKEKGYHHRFLNAGKELLLLGIGFSPETRNVSGYLSEAVPS